MKELRAIIFTLLFLIPASQHTLYAQPSVKALEKALANVYPDDQPGIAVSVWQDGKVILKRGFGQADLKTQEDIAKDTHFRMASVSKQFTAMCILLLQQQKMLDVEDAAIKYLPSLPRFASAITVQQLMNHTSGIADYEPVIPEGTTDQISDADVLALVSQSDSLYFTPGTRFRYSNTGFCLLTQIIEAVTGKTYPEFVREQIFLPLGMLHSQIYQSGRPIFKRAYGYHKAGGKWAFADQSITSATMGDGSVYTSIDEYGKWINALWNRDGEGRLAQISFPDVIKGNVSVKPGLSYANGWFIAREKDGAASYFHSGESTGFHNIVYHNPRVMIVLFSNCDDDRIVGAFDMISDLLGIRPDAVPAGQSLFNFLSHIYGD